MEPFLLLGNSDGCFRVVLSQLVYCTSYNSSTQFHLLDKRTFVISKSIGYYEQQLAAHGFLRVHNNTLLNTAYISHIGKGENHNVILLTTSEVIHLSRTRKTEILKHLQLLSVEAETLIDSAKIQPNS